MPKGHPCCDPGRIEQLLEGRLTSEEQSQVEQHLEGCATCRDRLETTAADPAYWKEAAAHLRSDALDVETGTAALVDIADSDGIASDEKLSALRIADYFDPTDDPRMLGRFDGYEIVGIIGFGGMGVVLKGFEPALDRYVAIKLLAPHLASSGAARARFAREARAAAAVLHENVVAIHRVSEAKDLPYLVMPYMPSESLQKRLNARGPMQLNEILRIGMQISAGLAAAHAQGLVHRDIKPGNILLDNGVERVTITDFGLARAADDASLTRSGVIAGTPQYMSPEQARGEPLDSRSDLFSLGSVLYTMCVGRAPFRAQSAFGVLHRISESVPTAIRELVPETPSWLCEIIGKLHAKDPGDRFQSAGEVADLLGRWLAHIQQPLVIPSPPRTGNRKRRARKPRQIAAAVVIGIVGLGLTVAFWLRWPPANTDTGPENRVSRPADIADAARAQNLDSSAQAIMDESALQESCQSVRQHISQVHDAWYTSSSVNETEWQSTIFQLHRRMDDLGQRIDRNPL